MYHISSNNSQGWLLLIFLHKKGVIFWGRRFFQILLTGSHALNILFCYPNKSKNDHVKQTEHGISKCSKFGSLINFQCQCHLRQSLNRHRSVLLDQIPLRLDKEGIKVRKDGKWGGGGQLFKGGNHFQYFRLGGGDYLREAINWGTAIIQGNNYGTHRFMVCFLWRKESGKISQLDFDNTNSVKKQKIK